MSASIRAQFVQLHRKVHQLVWLNGLCWGLTILLISASLVISLDWALKISDPMIRLILGLGAGSFVVWTLWQHLVIPLKTPLTDFDLALKIERQYPRLKDSFSSSVLFDTEKPSHFTGSSQLRQAVIKDAYQQASQINFLELIDTRPIRKIMISAALLCLFVVSISILHPNRVILGIHRFVLPFSAPDWPQNVELQFLDENLVPIESGPNNPYQVVEGENFRFFVENRNGTPPEDLRIEYQVSKNHQPRGKLNSEPLRIVSVPDQSAVDHELGTGSLRITNKTIRLRAIGGDDHSMPWLTLLSVPPTTLKLQEVTLTPPAYSQEPVEKLPAGIGSFKALIGTRVDLKARSNKLLKSVSLRVKDREPVSVKLEPNRKEFSAQFVIQDPGTYSYWFELENDQGFRPLNPERYEIIGITDSVPEVYLEKPATDLQVTPSAQIPLTVSIQDDLKIASALIRFQKSSKEETLSRALRTDRESQSFPLPFSPNDSSEQVILNDVWDLTKLSLTEGDRIIFRAEAHDHYQMLPQAGNENRVELNRVGTSLSRVLTLVSPQYKANELANRHAHLLEELTRVLKNQRLLHTEVKDVQHQLERVGKARSEEIDTIKQVEMDQKRITSQLFSPRTGLEQRSKELVKELEWNHINDPTMSQRLTELNTELSELNQNVFPEIQEQITQARKKLQSNIDSGSSRKQSSNSNAQPETRGDSEQSDVENTKQHTKAGKTEQKTFADNAPLEALNIAEKGQQQVISRLDNVLKSLSQWQKTRDLVSELEEQIQQQSDIQNQTSKLAQKTITKSFGKLKLQEQADLEKLASRQEQQAENFKSFKNLLDSLNSKSGALTREEQLRNQEAIDFLRKKTIPEEMKQIAEKLKQNQVGQVLQDQQKIQQSMQLLKDIFDHQSTDSSPDQLLKKLKQSEQELSFLKQQQQNVLQKLQKAANSSNQTKLTEKLEKLIKEEQELRQKLKQFEQQLKRLSLQQEAQSVQRARNRLSKIENALKQGNLQDATTEIQESLDDLEQAQRELASRRKDMEESLAFEALEKLDSEIKNLLKRQEAVIQETIRLEEIRLSRGRWSRGQLKSLKQLFETEQELQSLAISLALDLEAAPVFALAFQKIIDQLDLATNRLGQRLTDKETLTAEKIVRSKLIELLKVLDDRKSQNQNQPDPAQDLPESIIPPNDQISLITQLKLLKLLQEDILQRTKSFNQSISQVKTLTPQQIQERKDLSEEQAALAELSMELLARFNEPLSDDPQPIDEIPQ
ncbi:DUF4175 family protein [Gimesia aquarii]|uniref:Uncharacterized protein n=1 Tax=Gimesia aquarii TaxID=2527964 RepID=A0A517VT26_9PLAN|nr:DUF4175 family protein [Gimesia aquarii]QDT96152.1 hypothetical protein V144x_16050 [Gimesia aquarii]